METSSNALCTPEGLNPVLQGDFNEKLKDG